MAGDPMDSLLMSLIEKEIPDGRNALLQSHNNLAELSEYCRENYINSADKSKALQETKEYASQSLASVAYQIHSLAVNILQMMDQQTIQLQKMQSNANNVGLLVDIHKEKVARREIGVLTSSKNFSRSHKVVPPAQPEKLKKYKREEIDYNALDHIGHGVKSERKEDTTSQRRFSTSSSSGSLKENSTSSVHSSSQGSLQGLQGSLYHASSSERKAQFGNTMPPPPRPPIAPVAPMKPKSSHSGPPGPAPPTPVMAAPPSPSTTIPAAPPPPAPATSVLPPPPPPPPAVTVPEPDYDGKYSSTDSTSTTSAPTTPTSTLNRKNSSSERTPKRISTIYPIVPHQPPKTQSVSIAIMSSPVSSRSSSRSSNRSCPVVSALPTFSPGEPLTPTGSTNTTKFPFPAFVESQDYSDESDEGYNASTIAKSPMKISSSKSSIKSLSPVKSPYIKSPTKSINESSFPVNIQNSNIPSPPAPPPPPLPNAAIPNPPPPPPAIFGSSTHHSSVPIPPPPPPPPDNLGATKIVSLTSTQSSHSPVIPIPPPLPPNDDSSPDEYPTVKKRPQKVQPPPRTPPYSPQLKSSPIKSLNSSSSYIMKHEEPEYAVPFKVPNDMNTHHNERDSHERHIIQNGYTGHNGFDDMDTKGLPAPPPPPPPEDFYQVPPNNAPVTPMTPIDDLPPPPPDNLYEMVGDENHYESVANPNVLPPPPPMLAAEGHIIPATYEEKVVAIYDYQKLRDDELELTEGDVIYVIKKNEDGWFEGIKDGIQGLFPGNYVTSYM